MRKCNNISFTVLLTHYKTDNVFLQSELNLLTHLLNLQFVTIYSSIDLCYTYDMEQSNIHLNSMEIYNLNYI